MRIEPAVRTSLRFVHQILDAVYPDRCELCGTMGGPPICPDCARAFTAYGEISPPPIGLDRAHALYDYEGPAGLAVRRLKFERRTALGRSMAEALAARAAVEGLDRVDWIVPVPIHPLRWCARGFNQSELLAEGFPAARVADERLRRHRATAPQVRVDRETRRRQLQGAFVADPRFRGTSVLLIDDVLTTGGTVTACAESLRGAGAVWIGALVFAAGGVR